MTYRILNIFKKRTNLFYLLLFLMAISIPLIHYPQIYGVDAFQVLWMAQALRNGALFSENTWLIHPASYFGYYPFSHRAIGIPLVIAFLISLIEIISFGVFGIVEAILVFDILLIIIVYKSARSLGNTLFREEWSRFIFVAATLLSVNLINDTMMTVSTRIIITIIMINLLNISIKLLRGDGKENKLKNLAFLFILLLIGAFTHRLWMGTVFIVIFLIIAYSIRKYEKLQHISIFLIIPIVIIAFFYGLETYNGSYLFDLSTVGNILDLTLYIFTESGLISIFFPIGLIITIYKLTFSIKNDNLDNSDEINEREIKKDYDNNYINKNFIDQNHYLLLLIIPFSFIFVNAFYTLVLFLPIIIIFSVKGIVYIKEFFASFSEKLEWMVPLSFLFILLITSVYRFISYTNNVMLGTIISLSLLFFAMFIAVYYIINYSNLNLSKSNLNINSNKLKVLVFISVFTVSNYTFSLMTVGRTLEFNTTNAYPWMNSYLTEEDRELINFFHDVEIDGLIFSFDRLIGERLAGVGFLPTISEKNLIGTSLYYGIISPMEIIKSFKFTLSEFANFIFYYYTEPDPIDELRTSISGLNLSLRIDYDTLLSYNIQFMITPNKTFYPGGVNGWVLMETLQGSSYVYSTDPIFTTEHLNVWRIY